MMNGEWTVAVPIVTNAVLRGLRGLPVTLLADERLLSAASKKPSGAR